MVVNFSCAFVHIHICIRAFSQVSKLRERGTLSKESDIIVPDRYRKYGLKHFQAVHQNSLLVTDSGCSTRIVSKPMDGKRL